MRLRLEVVSQHILEMGSREKEPALDCSNWDADDRRDLLIRSVLPVMEKQNRSKLFAHGSYTFFHGLAQLRIHCNHFRLPPVVGDIDLLVVVRRGRHADFSYGPVRFSSPIDAQVISDSKQPRSN